MGKMFKALEKAERERYGNVAEKEPAAQDEILRETVRTDGTMSTALVVSSEPGSLAAEQFRKLRINLKNVKFPEPPRIIMVTSAKESEGKTLIAANLAVTIAQDLNTHALLIEADIRSPMLTRWFNCPSSVGLSNYLSDGIEPASIIQKTPIDKLSLIPGGDLRENPVELIGSKKMEVLIQELRARYADRYIIIDSSPLLATSEPNVMQKWIDAVLLVIRAGDTPREEIQQALGHLKREKIIGVVLNDLQFNIPAMHSKYFGSANYYHRYARGEGRPGGARGWRRYISLNRRGAPGSHDIQDI